MYRVVIADDEKVERSGICFLLKQIKEEFVIEEFPNGQAAYEWFQQNQADILLTDVRMPFMDGMELIRRVSSMYPKMKIVIFSGFNEFEYARTAMRYHVENYILKPVDPEEFEQTITQVIRKLEIQKKETEKKKREADFLEEHILYSLVNGVSVSELRKKFAQEMNVSVTGRYRRLLLIEYNRDFFGTNEDVGQALSRGLSVSCKYLNLNPQQSLLFLEEANPDWERLAAEIRRILAGYEMGGHFYLAASRAFSREEEVSRRFEETELLMEQKFYQKEGSLFLPEDEPGSQEGSQKEDDILIKQMRQAIRVKDMESLKSGYDRLCEKYRDRRKFSQIYVKFLFSNLLKECYEGMMRPPKRSLSEEMEKLYRSNSFSEVAQIVQNSITILAQQYKTPVRAGHPEIEQVKQYIYQNYGEDIGIEMLAEKVYMAPAYLSTLFKKETGQNLSKFIKAVRMEKAKELLETTHCKIMEVSNSVGYPNVSYFCQSFREYFGISPQKFRSKGEVYDEALEENQ